MSVFTKLNAARAKFHELKLEKTGHNKFAGYFYFELGDFLIPALRIFDEVGLCAIVSFDKELATMTIVDIQAQQIGTQPHYITITSPFGSASLKGTHEIQNIGACETYCRRYLWVAALEIVEHDALDATTGKAEKEEAFGRLQPEIQSRMRKVAALLLEQESASRMLDVIDQEQLDNDEKAGLWYLLDSKTRAAIKKAQEQIA
jgi:hypothetical protein